MKDLIPDNYENGTPTVSGRELYAALGVTTDCPHWFSRMRECGYTEDKDFCSFFSESTGGRPRTDHRFTIPMTKEQNTVKQPRIGRDDYNA